MSRFSDFVVCSTNLYSCGLSTATIEYSSLSVCLSVMSVCLNVQTVRDVSMLIISQL